MREQQANYATGQDYGDDKSRLPSSARKYLPPRQPTAQQMINDAETIEYSYVIPASVPARKSATQGKQPVIEDRQPSPKRRWDTREDYHVRPEIIPQQQPRIPRPMAVSQQQQQVRVPQPQQRGISRRGLVAGIVGSLVVGVIGGNAALGALHDVGLLMAQGPYPDRNVDLYCGHGEQPGHPTQLHVFIWDYKLHTVEYPGGDETKSHGFTGVGLPGTGDMSKWDLQVLPVKVGAKTYQIEITVTGVSGTGQSFTYHWLLVDGGHGYFVGVDTK